MWYVKKPLGVKRLRGEHKLRVFENSVLKKINEPKMNGVTGEWRGVYKQELYAVFCSPNISRGIKLKRMRWMRHVAGMGDRRSAHRILVGYLRERDHLEEIGVDGRIILKLIFKKWGGVA